MGNQSKQSTGGAFGRPRKKTTPIDARIARLGGKKLALRRRLLDYARDGDITDEQMAEALRH